MKYLIAIALMLLFAFPAWSQGTVAISNGVPLSNEALETLLLRVLDRLDSMERSVGEITAPKQDFVPQEGRASGIVYLEEEPKFVSPTTRNFDVPSGYKMQRVKHPPKYIITEYPQPDTFEMKQIHVAPVGPKTLTEKQAAQLRDVLGRTAQ